MVRATAQSALLWVLLGWKIGWQPLHYVFDFVELRSCCTYVMQRLPLQSLHRSMTKEDHLWEPVYASSAPEERQKELAASPNSDPRGYFEVV